MAMASQSMSRETRGVVAVEQEMKSEINGFSRIQSIPVSLAKDVYYITYFMFDTPVIYYITYVLL